MRTSYRVKVSATVVVGADKRETTEEIGDKALSMIGFDSLEVEEIEEIEEIEE